MKIESIKIHNYKVFKDVEVKDISNMAVFLGKNGVGKTTFFDVFGFLHDCLNSNVRSALAKRGGFKEVVSREQKGNIEFTIKFRASEEEPLITYEISIGLDEHARAVVKKEVLRFRRGQKGSPWKVLDFSCGEGIAAEGKLNSYEDVNLAKRRKQKLDSPDILAIKGLGQFKEFEAVSTFRRLIEDWYVADFRIDAARERQEAEYGEQLSRTGDNLSVVTKYLYDNHPDIFNKIIENMKLRVPGVEKVEAQETQDGYIVLRFQDGKFQNPFSASPATTHFFVPSGLMAYTRPILPLVSPVPTYTVPSVSMLGVVCVLPDGESPSADVHKSNSHNCSPVAAENFRK